MPPTEKASFCIRAVSRSGIRRRWLCSLGRFGRACLPAHAAALDAGRRSPGHGIQGAHVPSGASHSRWHGHASRDVDVSSWSRRGHDWQNGIMLERSPRAVGADMFAKPAFSVAALRLAMEPHAGIATFLGMHPMPFTPRPTGLTRPPRPVQMFARGTASSVGRAADS